MKQSFRKITRYIFFIAFSIGILYIFISLLNENGGHFMVGKVDQISIRGVVSINGKPLSNIDEKTPLDGQINSFVVTGAFSHDIKNGESLIIWPRNLRVKIYVNDKLKASAGQRESFPSFIEYAGNSYQIFYIGNVTTNDVVRIVVDKAYTSCRINVVNTFFQHMYIGKEGDVYRSIMSREIIHLIIGMLLILIGGIIVAFAFLLQFSQYQSMRRINYLGWYFIIGGLTYFYDSSYEYIDLLLPYPVFNTLMDLCCLPLLIFFYLIYITNALHHNNLKSLMKWLTIIFVIVELIPIIMQLTGIRDMHELQDQYVYLGGIVLLITLSIVFFELLWFKTSELRRVLVITAPVTICLTLKIINVVLERGVERSFIRIGILTSCLLLFYDTLKFVDHTAQIVEQEQKTKEELQNAHIAIMLSQIQPHFLYNALNTLEHICRKNGALAAEAIEHFSRYLRGNMDSLTNEQPIPFIQELEHVKHYLYIEQLRFGERVHVEYNLGVTDFYIPTLTLQPIVENAIRHGITKQAEGGTIKITTRSMLDEVWIIVADNGIGFDVSSLSNKGSDHVGINNVKKRVQMQCGGSVDIRSKIGIGTEVTIRLKGTELKENESYGC